MCDFAEVSPPGELVEPKACAPSMGPVCSSASAHLSQFPRTQILQAGSLIAMPEVSSQSPEPAHHFPSAKEKKQIQLPTQAPVTSATSALASCSRGCVCSRGCQPLLACPTPHSHTNIQSHAHLHMHTLSDTPLPAYYREIRHRHLPGTPYLISR